MSTNRYVQVQDLELFMCRDCPVGSGRRWLVIHQTEAHDRWHADTKGVDRHKLD